MLRKIVSGGQSGVDRAALDSAMQVGLETGGWCPAGRLAEDGPIPGRYGLKETPGSDYGQRTVWNVRDSGATLILYRSRVAGGTRLAAMAARRLGRPLLTLDLTVSDAHTVAEWVAEREIHVLNIAGPRESESPGVYGQALAFLREFLDLTIAKER